MSFDQFKAILTEVLPVKQSDLQPGTYLITDLGVDSIRMAELVLRLEELGAAISPDAVWHIETVGDAYALYLQSLSDVEV